MIELSAKYYDGESSRALDVRVRLDHFADILRALTDAAGGDTGNTALQYLASHPPPEARVRRFESAK
ncbi:MAG TPA: hypothetical protein VKY73_12580 [Polyangiaceae bacterium]|nr:hypothetical protein [Polyangiaceae bacterium]